MLQHSFDILEERWTRPRTVIPFRTHLDLIVAEPS